jgi:hypothetical protein
MVNARAVGLGFAAAMASAGTASADSGAADPFNLARRIRSAVSRHDNVTSRS